MAWAPTAVVLAGDLAAQARAAASQSVLAARGGNRCCIRPEMHPHWNASPLGVAYWANGAAFLPAKRLVGPVFSRSRHDAGFHHELPGARPRNQRLPLAVPLSAGLPGRQFRRTGLSVQVIGGGPPAGGAGEAGQAAAFFSSLVVPGLGQYRLGARRWIVYAGLEVLSGFLYVDSRADARELRAAYRDFAWERARLGLGGVPRQDGSFEYYETLSKWARSGAWDADPALDGLQPEDDPGTFNGSIWALAAGIYALDPAALEDSPGYVRALDYYRERAYGPSFLWQWPSGDDQSRFGSLIAGSDERFRDARRALWMLVANHLLSSLDAFVTARLRVIPTSGNSQLTFAFNAF